MKTFVSEGNEITVPDIIPATSDSTIPKFRIIEGDHKNIEFQISNIRMDDTDECLMWYDLDTWPENKVDEIKEVVNNFILLSLYEQMEKFKNENPPIE